MTARPWATCRCVGCDCCVCDCCATVVWCVQLCMSCDGLDGDELSTLCARLVKPWAKCGHGPETPRLSPPLLLLQPSLTLLPLILLLLLLLHLLLFAPHRCAGLLWWARTSTRPPPR